jgi:RNA polymerase sigma factor (sigma-70 family)
MNGWRSSSPGTEAFGAVAPAPFAPAEREDPVSTPPPGPEPASWDWDRLDAHLRPRLLNVGRRRFGLTPEEAEDVLQDTFESVFSKRPRVHNMKGYLVGSFFNRCRDRLEKRLLRGGLETPLPAEFPDAYAANRLVDGLHVRSAFRLLTPRCRHLIQAYCVFRRSLAETAADAGCTVTAVSKRLNQCMKRMRGCLG